MKCQIQLPVKNKKNLINLLSAESAQSVILKCHLLTTDQ